MILYHGSNLEIEKPDLAHSRENVDFGRGFYTTPIREQAEKWCGRYKNVDRKVLYHVIILTKKIWII